MTGRLGWVVALAILAAACTGTNAGPGGRPSGPTLEGDLSGTWSGTWADSTPDTSEGTFGLMWEQQGSALEGTITMEGTACLADGVVRGSLSGDDVEFRVVQREVEMIFTGKVFGGVMSGSYSSTCDDARGEWEATKAG